MSDINSTAAKNFYRLVRDFALRAKPWDAAVFYQVTPDEAFDITLVSRRVYGNPNETLCVMAAAGLDTVDQELIQKQIILPTVSQLYYFKRRAGFESDPQYRKSGKPTWAG